LLKFFLFFFPANLKLTW